MTCPSGSEVGRKGYSVGVVEAEDEVAGDPLHMAEVKEPLHQLEPRGVIPIYIAIIPLLSISISADSIPSSTLLFIKELLSLSETFLASFFTKKASNFPSLSILAVIMVTGSRF